MNPLLQLQYNTPHNTFPFGDITTENIEEAIHVGMKSEMDEVQRIVEQNETPTFENTIVALANTGELLERATTLMYNQLSANTNDDLESLAERMAPVLSEHSNNIFLNEALFQRVKVVHDNYKPTNDEDAMLLVKTFLGFERNGACLPEDKKKRFREIKAELSTLSLQFGQNNIRETNDYTLNITDAAQLAGLPESQMAAAAAAAAERGLEGWVFTLHAPSLHPFLQYCKNGELRRQMYMAANTRCTHDNESNNYEICRQIVNLRLELAQILGYNTYAEYVLKNRMAQNVDNVMGLVDSLCSTYLPAARREVADVEAFAQQSIAPWDFGHFSHLLKLRDYNVDAEMLRPYFALDNVIDGVFGLATRLYGITFRENKEIPVYHPDVKTFEVFDADGSFLAVFYADFFPRDNKQSGAWMTSYREQHLEDADAARRNEGQSADNDIRPHVKDIRPHVSVVMNFTKPIPASADSEGRPSLLTLSEVETFLHEFGHALHGIFARSRYASLSGTNVYWDFVELPSQFMENYAMQPEFLRTFARHYQAGEVIPDELIERVRRARNFNVAYACVRQLSFSLLDMSYYNRTQPLDGDIREHELEAWRSVQLLPAADWACMTVQFGHIMSGGYAAGYYSYKWAEVLDADAFEAFVENGLFDRTTADAFRYKLLAKGGTVHPAQLYRDFRGHDATIDALLRRDGIEKG